EHRRVKELAESLGVAYSSSVWDMTSAREIAGLHPVMIKGPSACNTHLEMIAYLCGEFGGEIHGSLGMTTREEEERLVTFIDRRGRLADTVLYACVSGYPVAFEDLSLLEVERLIADYGGRCKGIGYSGHH